MTVHSTDLYATLFWHMLRYCRR